MVKRAEWPSRAGVPFRVDVHPARDRVRVVPVGELDVATAPELERIARVHEFSLVAGPPAIRRVVEMCGLYEQPCFVSHS